MPYRPLGLDIYQYGCNNMDMKRTNFAVLVLLLALPVCACAQALDDLLSSAGSVGDASVPAVSAPQLSSDGSMQAQQYLPPKNDEPGFNWTTGTKAVPAGNFFSIGKNATSLKVSTEDAAAQADGAGTCQLAANTLYKAASKPGFEGENMVVELAEPLPGCQLMRGYVPMEDVASSSAGGAWQLPRTVHAFVDTLAYSEGTKDHYNYLFTFVPFDSYAAHPRKVICSGKLCSDASGRYQFLSKTWDSLASDLSLQDFTPPNQEKAVLELVRRAGAYNLALNSDKNANFSAAVKKLNKIWASLPGSPYGQPTHTVAALWKVYQAALAKY
jgi:muramidase (phage lysozyme)